MTAAFTALGALLSAALALFALTAAVVFGCDSGRSLARKHRRPAPPPAPGPPLTETPAQPPGHDSGGLESVAKRYRCGCRHWHDATGRLVAVEPGECRSAGWDAALKKLTS